MVSTLSDHSTMDHPFDDNIEIIYDNYKPDKSNDGRVHIQNPHLDQLEYDILYHLALDTRNYNFEAMFGDVKFVCMGGTVKRMREFAQMVAKEFNIDQPLVDLTQSSHRYSMFKVGPLLSISHGIGVSSLSILLNEILKLIHYAKCTNVTFFRIGTSGGIGIPPGTVIITEEAVDELLRPFFESHIQGKIIRRSSEFDKDLIKELKQTAELQNNSYKTIVGKTMCAMDFYETQSRLDGFFCNYTNEDKENQLRKISQAGVVNIEMESLLFGSICRYAGIAGAIVCVTLVNRLDDDQILSSKQELEQWQKRPQKLVLDFIKRKLGL